MQKNRNNEKNQEYRKNKKINKANIRNGRNLKEYMIYGDDGIFDEAPTVKTPLLRPQPYQSQSQSTVSNQETKQNNSTEEPFNEDANSETEEFTADYFEPIPYK